MTMRGGGTHGGGTHGGGTHGGGTHGQPGENDYMNALGDVYATPVFCEAMNAMREACIDPGDHVVWGMREPWDERDQARIGRWDSWVRSYLCAQALISDISIQANELRPDEWPLDERAPGHHPARRLQVTVSANLPIHEIPAARCCDDDDDEPRTRHRKVKIATIVRPPDVAFQKQIPSVLAWADLRQERMPEILAQIQNTYAFWGSQVPIQTDRLRCTRELLDAAVQFAMFVEMRCKNDIATWRPTDYSAQVQPVITTPGHGSMPCGHCTEAYVIKEVLQSLLMMQHGVPEHDVLRTQFSRIAARLSVNRVIAGVHFPLDNLAGRLLGKALGRYFAYRCGGYWSRQLQPQLQYGVFRGDLCTGTEEFVPDEQGLFSDDAQDRPPFYEVHPITGFRAGEDGQDPILKSMWARAREEIKLLQLAFESGAA